MTALGVGLLTQAAQAQLMAGPGLGGKQQQAKPAPPPPPALPGAQTDSDRVTPAEKQATDVPPTDALFDAINRGDITSARDAIGRGADLQGHNLLGMTPMELAVDLGRNNIAFLLLSLRAGDQGAARPTKAAETSGAAKPGAAKPGAARLSHSQRAERLPTSAVRKTAAAPAPQTPRLFAGDGGTPIPSAGFLGFDPGRAAPAR